MINKRNQWWNKALVALMRFIGLYVPIPWFIDNIFVQIILPKSEKEREKRLKEKEKGKKEEKEEAKAEAKATH